MDTDKLEERIKEKGYAPEWSICKVLIADIPRYFFRILELQYPEASGDTLSEAIDRYLLDLPDKKKK